MPVLCVSSPYLPNHFGGGEKYLLDIATTALQLGWQVTIAVPQALSATELANIREKYQSFYGQPLKEVRWISATVLSNGSWWQKWQWSRQFDALFWVTDGSVFLSGARQNILHIQIPFSTPLGMATRMKLHSWQYLTANSTLTQRVIDQHWGIHIPIVHWPMVSPICTEEEMIQLKKEKIILHVGRFFRQLHSKRQDILVQAFRQLYEKHPKLMKDWQLVLVGNVEDPQYLDEVKSLAKGLPVKILTDVSRKDLEKWYRKAQLYWHATGYEVNESEHPEQTEHFGITTVEAMTAGAIPLVVLKGGQGQVVGSELARLGWETIPELVEKTANLLRNQKSHASLQSAAYTQARAFSAEQFYVTLSKILTPQL